jgi:hypothetical protein
MATICRVVRGASTQPIQMSGLYPTIWGWTFVVMSDPIIMVVVNVAVIFASNSLQVASEFGPNRKNKLQAEVIMQGVIVCYNRFKFISCWKWIILLYSCGAIGNPTSNSKRNVCCGHWARQRIQMTVVPMGEPSVNNNTMFVVAIGRDNKVK